MLRDMVPLRLRLLGRLLGVHHPKKQDAKAVTDRFGPLIPDLG
jgi:hypothetical protein